MGYAHKLIYSNDLGSDFWELDWEKQLSNDLYNPYDSLKVFISRADGSLAELSRFNYIANASSASISSEKAFSIAGPIINNNKLGDANNCTISLKMFRPNYLLTEGGPYDSANYARLAWEINMKDTKFKLYIDAITGENIGADYSLTNGAKAFGTDNVPFSDEDTTLANAGLQKLGYIMQPRQANVIDGGDITTYWARSDAYGFYITCHGGQAPNYSISDNENWALFPNQVTGNWHFVYLDTCWCGQDTTWANAFKTNGYSSRGFMGWATEVDGNNTHLFNTYFWPLVGTKSLRNAAIQAANNVPGAGTTPIRYYGDQYYYGWAW